MEGDFSTLNISRSIPSSHVKKKGITRTYEHFNSPKPIYVEQPNFSTRSPLSLRGEHLLNHSNLSQTSGKENSNIPELSLYKNRIIKQEMFYERILRKFKEKQEAITQAYFIMKQKPPEDVLKEELDVMKNEFRKIQPTKKKIFTGVSREDLNFIKCQMSRPKMEYVVKGQTIRINDLKTLYQSDGWLNDEVVNHYLHMIVARDSNSLHMFETFFYHRPS